MRIKEVIKREGLTSIEVAKRMGVVPEAVSRIINGNPTIDTIERVADAIGVHVTELFDPPTSGTSSGACPHCGRSIEIEIKIKPPGQ